MGADCTAGTSQRQVTDEIVNGAGRGQTQSQTYNTRSQNGSGFGGNNPHGRPLTAEEEAMMREQMDAMNAGVKNMVCAVHLLILAPPPSSRPFSLQLYSSSFSPAHCDDMLNHEGENRSQRSR